jgi:tyrosyl-tRNA synthetase
MSGLVPSNSEARRQIQQGAVEVDGTRVVDPNEPLQAGREYLIRVGKRRFKRVFLERTGA